MITNANSQDLAKRIEQLVQAHIAASREVAKAAVERAFAKAKGESARPPQGTKPITKPTRQRAGRRESAEVAALSERLYAAICQMPGETMMVLAPKVGVTPQELRVPVKRLKQAGRVRSVGQRSHMRYFPMASEANADKEARA